MTTAFPPTAEESLDAAACARALDAAFLTSLDLLRQALEQLPFSVLLVDDRRNVIHANSRARQRLLRGDVIAEVRGQLQACGAEREAFDASWAALCASPDAVGQSFHLKRAEAGPPLRIDASCLLNAPPDVPGCRLWMLRLADTALSRGRLAADWRARFGLTAAECKVGLALIEYGDAISIGEALHIASNTARAHLKSMFAKAGVRSQTALALRLTLDGPLAE